MNFTKQTKKKLSKLFGRLNAGEIDWLQERKLLADRIMLCAENGKIAVVQSGMDCDCVEYDGQVTILSATVPAFVARHDKVADWADGPFSLRIVPPSRAENIVPTSRDRALEAYENQE